MTSVHDPAASGSRVVTSLQNDTVKLVRSLEMRKARRETGLFVAEGAALLITARDHGWIPKILVHGPGAGDQPMARGLIHWAREAGADCLDVTAPVLAKIAARDNPQSLIGVFEQRLAAAPRPQNITAQGPWLALEAIRDPGNLGTILRTADAAGVAGILLVGTTCDPFQHEAVRASMGSIFAVPLVKLELADLIELAKAWPGSVVGTHLKGTQDFRQVTYASPTLLVMGSEGDGLSREATAACKSLVRIPMLGRLDSLNLAVATGLMLYEIQRAELKL
ncbi:MAG: TrmH family RNA methyltransferase [Hyphomicrobiaceae bacterium]